MPEELYVKSQADFKHDIDLQNKDTSTVEKVVKLRLHHYETRRQEKLKILREERRLIISEMAQGVFKLEENPIKANNPFWVQPTNSSHDKRSQSQTDLKWQQAQQNLNQQLEKQRLRQEQQRILLEHKLKAKEAKRLEIISKQQQELKERNQDKEARMRQKQAFVQMRYSHELKRKQEEYQQKEQQLAERINEFELHKQIRRVVLKERAEKKVQDARVVQEQSYEQLLRKQEKWRQKLNEYEVKVKMLEEGKQAELNGKIKYKQEKLRKIEQILAERREQEIRWREEVRRKLAEADLKQQMKKAKEGEEQLLRLEYQRLKRLDREEAALRLQRIDEFERQMFKNKLLQKEKHIRKNIQNLPQLKKDYAQTIQSFWKLRSLSQSKQSSSKSKEGKKFRESHSSSNKKSYSSDVDVNKYSFYPLQQQSKKPKQRMLKEIGRNYNSTGNIVEHQERQDPLQQKPPKHALIPKDIPRPKKPKKIMTEQIHSPLFKESPTNNNLTYNGEPDSQVEIKGFSTLELHKALLPVMIEESLNSTQLVAKHQQPRQGGQYLKRKVSKFRKDYAKQLNKFYKSMFEPSV